jgi:hypothetical protein
VQLESKQNTESNEAYKKRHQEYVNKKYGVYAYKFQDDTLRLHKLESKDNGMLYNLLGNKQYTFLKQ